MKSVVVGTAGHIDHGKSALVRALTGTDPDRLKEEKARGITIDLGFAHLQAGDVDLAFVDVPGHERFVKNMLAGAGGIDMVMLVIAADESVMPQTREHFEICRLLHVPAGIIVLTKSDLADADMLALAQLEARELVQDSFLADGSIVAVSSATGAGLDELQRVLVTVARAVRRRDAAGPARLPIDRVFSVKGFGTVLTGTLVSGEIAEGDDLVILPRQLPVKVRGLQVHGHGEGSAAAGRRLAVNVGGIDVADVARGDTLCTPGAFDVTRRLDVALDLLAAAAPLKHGARVRFHHGTTEVLGRVAVAGSRRGDGPAAEIPAGGSAYARLRLESLAVLTRGDRFILRSYSPAATIGGGVVLDPAPPRSAIRTAAGRERLRRLAEGEGQEAPDGAVGVFLEERGIAGLPQQALVSRAGLSRPAATALVERFVADGRARAIGGLLVSSAAIGAHAERLIASIAAHHEAEPLSEGLPREEARERLFGRADPAVFEHVLTMLVGSGAIVARERLSRAGRQLPLSAEESRALESIERAYRSAGLAPPDLAAAARDTGTEVSVAERVAKLLLRHKTLVKLDTLLFHADALEGLKSDVRGLKTPNPALARVDVPAFKARYGISRKFAIPLLEYLDRERITRRVGDARVVL